MAPVWTPPSPTSPTQVALPRSPVPSRPASPSGVEALPVELVISILTAAVQRGERRTSILSYMLTCKTFLAPARRLLHEQVLISTKAQAESLLAALKQDPSLPSATRRLTLLYSMKDGQESLPSRQQASRILKLMHNLRDLCLVGDEEDSKLWKSTLGQPATPGAENSFEYLEQLKTGKVRWDRLVDFLRKAPKLHTLDCTALYELSTEEGSDERPAASAEDSDDEADSDDQETSTRQHDQLSSHADSTYTHPSSAAGVEEDDDAELTVDRPPSPSPSLPSLKDVPTTFSLPFRSLTLNSPTLSDATTLALCTAVRGTLTSLALVRTTTLSRLGLLQLLSSLPNLLELELSGCNLPSPRSDDPPPPPSITTQQLSYPLDELATLCPFLQWLKLESDHVGSHNILTKLACLPLSSLSIGFSWPRLDAEAIRVALDRIPSGRLDSLFVSAGMKWTSAQLDEVRRTCESVGTLFVGEPMEPPVLLF
ncbi:hypothetical protein BCR35DRAFT_335840 [Leucosporidium creatinivorum]|uniref:Proteophosphoglycan ppg4 n=1 Tax=Leucosporidium creatinivorum TaxID=106004 RepID=A0A1Y2D6E2_9BASI|nr:hypothetical protein BCR35DRAFT_335840 [Leucosporidium creatinivorum]